MGVLNVTPDSFSDGGRYFDRQRAVAHAMEMAAAGAHIIDIGGESTRPGAQELSVEDECARVLPVIRCLRGRLACPISIDTRKAAVAEQALDAGAVIVNDVSAMTFDSRMGRAVAARRAAVILMHMRGTPATMMRMARYSDVVREVCAYLAARARAALAAGVVPGRIVLDPGIGFAKNARHNLILLNSIGRLRELGYPILIGVSRKAFIRRIAGPDEDEKMFGTAAAVAIAVAGGASIVRVHDPGPMAIVTRMAAAIARNAY